jgi:cell division protein FtsI/penicillin-binding protein 2
MIRQINRSRLLSTTLAALTLLLIAALAQQQNAAEAAPPLAMVLPRPADLARARLQRELDWSRVRRDGAGYVQVFSDGAHAELSLDPRLQALADKTLADHPTPYGAAVLLSVEDGRVLALAGRSQAEPDLSAADLTMKPWAPAASVFKIVTTAALVESGVGTDTKVCYHDGIHAIDRTNLVPNRHDDACRTLAFGLAKSQNAIIARLAHDHLTPEGLFAEARRFGFGAPLDFDLPMTASAIDVPRQDPLEYARAAAGFWHSTLSPLHGAAIAATIARGGTTPPLRLVERIIDAQGSELEVDGARSERVISAEVAGAVGRMMVGTTEYGTARLGFHDKHSGKKILPGVNVAGKTGSLNRKEPFLSYSWFVGYAPAERPEVAFAVLLGNDASWRWKAHQVAADLLHGYFHGARDAAPAPKGDGVVASR